MGWWQREGRAKGVERAGICIMERKGFFCASRGEVKGCSLGFASVRDPDRFWAGLNPLGWAQKASGCEAEAAAKGNQVLFLERLSGLFRGRFKTCCCFPCSEEYLSLNSSRRIGCTAK